MEPRRRQTQLGKPTLFNRGALGLDDSVPATVADIDQACQLVGDLVRLGHYFSETVKTREKRVLGKLDWGGAQKITAHIPLKS